MFYFISNYAELVNSPGQRHSALSEAPKMPEAQWLAAENHLMLTTQVFVKVRDLALF
jgi:hypothetical protein